MGKDSEAEELVNILLILSTTVVQTKRTEP